MTSRDPLDDLLDRWRPEATGVPDLRPEVRRELAHARRAQRLPWLGRLELAFGRPSFAVTFILACVLLGLFLAEMRLTRLHAAYGAQIARSYVQLIDPLVGPTTQTPSTEAP